MGGNMSNCLINNIARVIDVRQVINSDLTSANHAADVHLNVIERKTAATVCRPSINGSARRVRGVNERDAVQSFAVLLSSLLTQILRALSATKDKLVPVIPTPPVNPSVVHEPVTPRPNSEAALPCLSNKRGGAKPDNIWSGFRQGPDGNCVTVSAIKAAMHRFGQSPTDIYQQVTRLSGGYRVVMRDDFQLTLTDRELAEGARGARFRGQDKGMLKDAQFLFAVSAKRAQMENNDYTAGRSYQAAIRSLNNGEDERGPGEGFMRLGLRKHMKTVSVRELARGQLGMCNRTGHSVAVINGREELWGRRGATPARGQAIALF